MPKKQMVKWYKAYRDKPSHHNSRLAKFIIDCSELQLDKSIFDNPLLNGIEAVKLITKNYLPPYTLLVSGGIDSQAMIYVWYKSKIPFNLVHFNYNGFNNSETEIIKQYANSLGISHLLKIKNFNVIEFINSSEYINYAKKYDCNSPHILTYMKLAESVEGTTLMSGNLSDFKWNGINYTIYGLMRYAELSKSDFIPFFFQSTAKLAYSCFDSNKISKSLDAYESRINCYKRFEVPLIIPTEGKLTGFEKIKEMYDETKVSNGLRFKYLSMPSKRPFDIIYRYGLFEHIGLYTEETTVLHPNFV